MTRLYSDNGFNPPRDAIQALRRGWIKRCPHCGRNRIYARWMQAHEYCPDCGEAFHHARISNVVPLLAAPLAMFPACFVLVIAEAVGGVPLLVEGVVAIGLALAIVTAVLPRAKGAAIGLAWARYADGFDPHLAMTADHGAALLTPSLSSSYPQVTFSPGAAAPLAPVHSTSPS